MTEQEIKRLLESDLAKCNELDITIREPVKEAVNAAFDLKMFFTISETRRTYERQCLLLSQGRTKSDIMRNAFFGGFRLNAEQMRDMLAIYDTGRNLSGHIVTYTLDSDHIRGLAMDVYPKNTTYSELAQFFMRWNIQHPYIFDLPHFFLGFAQFPPNKAALSPQSILRAFERRIANARTPSAKSMLIIQRDRLKKRLGV